MSEMIERLARSIAASFVSQNHMLELDEDGMGYSNDYDNRWYDCRPAARAAIEALRNPPEQVWAAAIGDGGWGDCEASEFVWRWNLAINTALKDTPHGQ